MGLLAVPKRGPVRTGGSAAGLRPALPAGPASGPHREKRGSGRRGSAAPHAPSGCLRAAVLRAARRTIVRSPSRAPSSFPVSRKPRRRSQLRRADGWREGRLRAACRASPRPVQPSPRAQPSGRRWKKGLSPAARSCPARLLLRVPRRETEQRGAGPDERGTAAESRPPLPPHPFPGRRWGKTSVFARRRVPAPPRAGGRRRRRRHTHDTTHTTSACSPCCGEPGTGGPARSCPRRARVGFRQAPGGGEGRALAGLASAGAVWPPGLGESEQPALQCVIYARLWWRRENRAIRK